MCLVNCNAVVVNIIQPGLEEPTFELSRPGYSLSFILAKRPEPFPATFPIRDLQNALPVLHNLGLIHPFCTSVCPVENGDDTSTLLGRWEVRLQWAQEGHWKASCTGSLPWVLTAVMAKERERKNIWWHVYVKLSSWGGGARMGTFTVTRCFSPC